MASSDIIKIGFDYRASLEQFEKETNGVFDGISDKAGKQKITIQLDAKDDKVIDKIKELQKLKLDKFTFEFGDSGLKEQLQTFDKLENKINEIINLSKNNLTTAFKEIKKSASLNNLDYGTDEYNTELKRVTSSIVEMGKKGQESTREYFVEVQKLLNLYEIFRKKADGNLFSKNTSQADKFSAFIRNSQLSNDLDPVKDTTSDIFNGCLAIIDNFVDNSTKKFISLKDVIEKVISVSGELESINDNKIGTNISEANNSQIEELKSDIQEVKTELGDVKDRISSIESNGFENVREDVEKTKESVKELNSELTEMKSNLSSTPQESNISSGSNPTPEVSQNNNISDSIQKKKEALASYELQLEETRYEVEKLSNAESKLPYGFNRTYNDEKTASMRDRVTDVVLGNDSSSSERSGSKKWYALGNLANIDASALKTYQMWQEELQKVGYTLSEIRDTSVGLTADIIPIDGKAITNAEEFRKTLDSITTLPSKNVQLLNQQITELESKISSLKSEIASLGSHSTDQRKDAFPNTDTKLDEAVTSAKDLDKTLKQVDIPTDSFDKVLEKLDRTKSELVDIVKITKQSVSDADGKFHDSYTLKDSRGSTEIYGVNSKTDKGQILRQNIVGYDVKKDTVDNSKELLAIEKQLQKEIEASDKANQKRFQDFQKEQANYEESVNKVNSAIQKTDEILDTLPLHDKLDGQFLDMIDSVDNLNSKLKSGELTLSEYKNEVKSVTSEYSKMVSIQQKRDVEDYNANIKADNTKKLEREKQIWDDLTTSLNRYATLQKRIASNNALSTDAEEAETLKSHIDDLKESDILPKDKLNIVDEKLQQINQTVADLKAKLKESTLDSLQGSIDKYQKIYNQRSTYSSDFTPSEQYTKNLTELNTAIKNLVEYRNALKNVGEVTTEQEAELKGLVTACEKASDSFKSLSASEKGASQIAVDKLVQRINKDLDECTNYSKKAKQGLRALRDELESANPRNLKEITSEIINIENAEIRAGRAGRSFFDTLKNSGFHQIAAQMAGMFGVYDAINLGKEGFNVVRELNTTLTEMRKVSDETVQSLKDYQATTFDTADAVGTTAKQIQNSTADWMRLGESMNQAAESAKDANVLLNVSEFEGIDEATESLVSMSQAYKDLDKMDIIDVLNNIGNNYSISTDGLATALKDSASALVTANNDLNEAVSLTTAGNAITQDPSKVGAGLRTISLRLVGTEEAKQELSDLGEETDGMITTVSKLRDTIMDATKAASSDGKGFDILDSNGNYKSTYEIMQGLADLYDDIVKKDKELGTNNLNLLLETIAGKNRSNIAASILQNGDMLRSVYEDAQNSEGSAEKELNSYLDSIDGKMAQLENRAQEFWFKVIDSETIKNGIDLLSTLLKGATDFVDTVGLLPTILTGIGAALSFKNVG